LQEKSREKRRAEKRRAGMAVAGEWQLESGSRWLALENGSRWRLGGAGDYHSPTPRFLTLAQALVMWSNIATLLASDKHKIS
jgi:hypothetical protein